MTTYDTLGLKVPSKKVGLGWVQRVQIPSEEVLGAHPGYYKVSSYLHPQSTVDYRQISAPAAGRNHPPTWRPTAQRSSAFHAQGPLRIIAVLDRRGFGDGDGMAAGKRMHEIQANPS